MDNKKKYKSRHYRKDFYGETLEELAAIIKKEYPIIATIHPEVYDPDYKVYVSMNYYGYDINTLKARGYKSKAKALKETMSIPTNDLKLMLVEIINNEPNNVGKDLDELKKGLKYIFRNLPEAEKNNIIINHSLGLGKWELM